MKKGYIAVPKQYNSEDELDELTIIKNRYAEELELPKYIAIDCDVESIPSPLHNSASTMKWFFESGYEFIEEYNVGVGDTISEAVNDLLTKKNPKR